MSFVNRIKKSLVSLSNRPSARKFLWSFNFSVRLSHRDDLLFDVPIYQGMGLSLVSPPPHWCDQLYLNILSTRSGYFFDVGCNTGQTFLLWLRHRSLDTRYVGIDPIPSCCSYLNHLCAKNAPERSMVICAAIGSEPRLAELHSVGRLGEDSEMSSLENSLRDPNTYQAVSSTPVVTGDSIRAHLDSQIPVSVIKIDVEGFEHEVLAGFHDTLERDRPIVISEVMYSNHPDPVEREKRREQVRETSRLMKTLSYSIWHTRHDGEIVELEELPVQDWKREDRNDYDFLFVPSESVEEFQTKFNRIICD